MQQARYWKWAKTGKPHLNPINILSYGDSWEEQAFAEDAAGTLGGCVWPPRSYSCSFCRREFRSAQALGGHMNVHRRDRARLKQSDEVVSQNHALNTCTSRLRTFLYNNNPNPDFSGTRVSSPPTTKLINSEGKKSTLCFLPLLVKNNVVSSNPPSSSIFIAEKRDRVSGKNNEDKKHKTIVEQDYRAEKEDCVTGDFPMSLNVIVRKQNNTCSDEVANCKRKRIEEKPSSLFLKVSAVDRFVTKSEALKFGPGPVEELDLELRLGDAPKVK